MIAKICEESKYPLTDEFINKNSKCYTTIEIIGICNLKQTCVALGGYYAKWNKSDKDKCYMLSLYVEFLERKKNKYNKTEKKTSQI